MTRARWLTAIAAAALCSAAVAGCARESAPPPSASDEPASEDSQTGAAPDTRREPSEAELEAKLEAYLGAEKQAYGSQSRKYLDEDQRAELSIPVPPVDPMERKAPDLLPPEPASAATRP